MNSTARVEIFFYCVESWLNLSGAQNHREMNVWSIKAYEQRYACIRKQHTHTQKLTELRRKWDNCAGSMCELNFLFEIAKMMPSIKSEYMISLVWIYAETSSKSHCNIYVWHSHTHQLPDDMLDEETQLVALEIHTFGKCVSIFNFQFVEIDNHVKGQLVWRSLVIAYNWFNYIKCWNNFQSRLHFLAIIISILN